MIGLYLTSRFARRGGDESTFWDLNPPPLISSSTINNKPVYYSPTSVLANNQINPWDEFYKLHKSSFFKDRHYLEKEHESLRQALKSPGTRMRIFDFGCGVGNSIMPLLESAECDIDYLGIDISPKAIEILGQRLSNTTRGTRHRFLLKVLDCSTTTSSGDDWDDILNEFYTMTNSTCKFDFCLIIFVLSAFHPNHHHY